eukprot:UN08981
MGSYFKIPLSLILAFSFVPPYFLGTYEYDPCTYSFGQTLMYIFTLLLALQITFVF